MGLMAFYKPSFLLEKVPGMFTRTFVASLVVLVIILIFQKLKSRRLLFYYSLPCIEQDSNWDPWYPNQLCQTSTLPPGPNRSAVTHCYFSKLVSPARFFPIQRVISDCKTWAIVFTGILKYGLR